MLERVDRVLSPAVWLVAATLVVMLFAGPQLVAEDKPAAPAAKTSGGNPAAAGRAVFIDNCASCHTLSAAGTTGTVGPPLDGAGLNAEEVARIVREGRGLMPSLAGSLSADEVEAVATFVAETSGG